MLIKSLPEEERPREKAAGKGIESLSDAELIALIVRTGRKSESALSLAEEILAKLGDGLSGMGALDEDELMEIDGMGPGKSMSLIAAVELGKRIAGSRRRGRPLIDSSEGIADMFMEDLRYKNKEFFKSVMVNAKGEVMSVDNVSVGELSRTLVHPREVFAKAVKKSAFGVILVHNHPSGDPSPSSEDIATTERLVESGDLLGIKVLDHVIIGDGRYTSMRALDLIK